MKYAASVGNNAISGTTTGIQGIHVVSSPVSERSLSVGDMIVMLALLPSGEDSNAMKRSLIDAGRSTARSKDGAARCPSGFDSARPRYVCHA